MAALLAWTPRGLAPHPWPAPSGAVIALFALGGAAALAAGGGAPPVRIERAALAETALALAVFDGRNLLIPDLYSAVFAAAGAVGPMSPGVEVALAGALAGGGLTALVRLAAGRALAREAMGWGDVKLAAALGALLGPASLMWTLAAAAGLGATAGLALRRRAPDAVVPFGAFLAPAAVAVLWMRA